MTGQANRSAGALKATAPAVYRPCPPPEHTGGPSATIIPHAVTHGAHMARASVQASPVSHGLVPSAYPVAPAVQPRNTAHILQRAAAPRALGLPSQFGPPVYKPAPGVRYARVVQTMPLGFGANRHALSGGGAGDVYGRRAVAIPPRLMPVAPVAAPPPLTTFPASKTDFTASEIETLFSEGQLVLGAPNRYNSWNVDGPSYSQNYSYALSYNSRVIAVLHIHYNTNNASDVKTAGTGLVKIKKSDFGATLAYDASAGLKAAARAKH